VVGILPASETAVFNVNAGDAITASISQTSGNQWFILLQDHTNGQTISTTRTYGGSGASAEFIHEAPTVNNNVVPLTPFSTFSFYDARVNGSSPALNANQRVTMVQNSTTVSSISTRTKPATLSPSPTVPPRPRRHPPRSSSGTVTGPSGPPRGPAAAAVVARAGS
jgi:hypothetical protein